MINFYWGRTPEFSAICERHALEDPDFEVRRAAVLLLGTCYRGTHDARIGRLIADMVLDSTQPDRWRKAAYQSLFSLVGRRFRDFLVFQFPEDVDWTFVKAFLEEHPLPSEIERMCLEAPFLDKKTCIALLSMEKAKLTLEQGELEDAIGHLTEVIRNMQGAGAYLLRGQAFLKLGRFDEAVEDFTKSLQIRPNSVKAHLGRSQAYEGKGLADLAKRDFDKAVAIDPKLKTGN
jgi:tetratricopeptide (TPR) repeat protein